jgi:hypothetical protein
VLEAILLALAFVHALALAKRLDEPTAGEVESVPVLKEKTTFVEKFAFHREKPFPERIVPLRQIVLRKF